MLVVMLAAGCEATAHDVIPSPSRNAAGAVDSPVQSVPRLRLPVAVFAGPDINDSLLSQMCAETEAIWRTAGIAFDWHRVTAARPPRTAWLHVTIDEGGTGLASTTALGWILFTAEGPQPPIHLSRPNAEELLLNTPGVDVKTIYSRETLLGRALGRALSHELGHYLLRSKTHTPRGLMQTARPSDDFFRRSRHGFEPTGEQREAAALFVQQMLAKSDLSLTRLH
jgi:hypothetical protein